MALARHPPIGYPDQPLAWQRPDLGRPVMRLVLVFLAFMLIGMAVAYLFMALAGAGTPVAQEGPGQAWPLTLFSAFFMVTFYWPLNVVGLFLFGLPILGLLRLFTSS